MHPCIQRRLFAQLGLFLTFDCFRRALCDDLASNSSLGTALNFARTHKNTSQERALSYQDLRCATLAFRFIIFVLMRERAAIRPDIGNRHLTTLLEGVSRASDSLWHDSVFKFDCNTLSFWLFLCNSFAERFPLNQRNFPTVFSFTHPLMWPVCRLVPQTCHHPALSQPSAIYLHHTTLHCHPVPQAPSYPVESPRRTVVCAPFTRIIIHLLPGS